MATSTKPSWDRIPIAVFSDPIFFHKSNVKVGSRFRNYGRLTSDTNWVVQAIWTLSHSNFGVTRHYVASVRTLKDRLELRCEETGEVKNLTFSGMSYSAIWRLDD
jgi:hypothetical protein